MKKLIAISILVIGCNNPDFWTCDESKQKEAAIFYRECTEGYSKRGYEAEECTERMQEIFCKPGYKEQLVPSKTAKEITDKVIKTWDNLTPDQPTPSTEQPKAKDKSTNEW
jgi:hypothetical protein